MSDRVQCSGFSWSVIARRFIIWGACLVVISVYWNIIGNALFVHFYSDDAVIDLLVKGELTQATAQATAISRSDRIVPALAKRLRHDPCDMIRQRAAVCLRRIAELKPEAQSTLKAIAVPALREALTDSSLSVRVSSARALWQLDSSKTEVLEVLMYVWRSGENIEKHQVYLALQDMGFDANNAAGTLKASLDDPDPWVRECAKNALAAIGHVE